MKDAQTALYARVSSEKQAEDKTIDSQLEEVPAKKNIKVLVVNAYVRENAGDAALLNVPTDDEALAGNLVRLLTDGALRDRQVAAGRARAALYTWSSSAAAHRAVYESVVSG